MHSGKKDSVLVIFAESQRFDDFHHAEENELLLCFMLNLGNFSFSFFFLFSFSFSFSLEEEAKVVVNKIHLRK